MKFICLGYLDEAKWDTMPASQRAAFMDECFAYDDELRRSGHWIAGEALQTARNAVTVRIENAKVGVTDGPFTETKEQIGGILIIDARDLNHAIALISRHPGLRAGGFEIRPSDDEIYKMYAARQASTNS